MAKKGEDEFTAEAREASEATLQEQSKMRPVPSQDDADRIKRGERVNADADQPKGPAADAAKEAAEANEDAKRRTATADGSAPYKTRAASKGE
ncbi:MAG: hypothetical protein V2I43_08780 [Parvularcula sp.]|nr:hypothetical protein [Parvularcula sp.]